MVPNSDLSTTLNEWEKIGEKMLSTFLYSSWERRCVNINHLQEGVHVRLHNMGANSGLI